MVLYSDKKVFKQSMFQQIGFFKIIFPLDITNSRNKTKNHTKKHPNSYELL